MEKKHASRCVALLAALTAVMPAAELTVSGTEFRRDGKPFVYTGISFFNAIYNPTFNRDSETRREWLRKFRRYGINVLRAWAQWDNARGFVDACPTCTLYEPDGRLRRQHAETLRAILRDAEREDMVIQLVFFSQESWRENIRLDHAASERAVTELATILKPHRNLVFQVWNEMDENTVAYVKAVKGADPARLVTNSPGFAGVLHGMRGEYELLDYLTPHTSRQNAGRHWDIAPREIEYLLKRWRKPVVDDEPARNGTPDFGGPRNGSDPYDHILQIWQVWQLGAYIVYHHDMFQTGYGTPPVPPSGIPDPEHNPYHRQVLEFIAKQDRYRPVR